MNFPHSTDFTAFHKFQCVVFLVSFVSRHFLISLETWSLTCWLFKNVLLDFNIFFRFSSFPTALDFQFHSNEIRKDLYDFNLLKFIMDSRICLQCCSRSLFSLLIFYLVVLPIINIWVLLSSCLLSIQFYECLLHIFQSFEA